jgi:hypothetical protein
VQLVIVTSSSSWASAPWTGLQAPLWVEFTAIKVDCTPQTILAQDNCCWSKKFAVKRNYHALHAGTSLETVGATKHHWASWACPLEYCRRTLQEVFSRTPDPGTWCILLELTIPDTLCICDATYWQTA